MRVGLLVVCTFSIVATAFAACGGTGTGFGDGGGPDGSLGEKISRIVAMSFCEPRS